MKPLRFTGDPDDDALVARRLDIEQRRRPALARTLSRLRFGAKPSKRDLRVLRNAEQDRATVEMLTGLLDAETSEVQP